jgi:E3 ubiquitin-protein ligase HUWE1
MCFSSSQDDEDQLTKEDYEALATPVIDEFTGQALKGCLALLDTLPDTVYRVCDLLLAVFNRNGTDFKESVLRGLMEQVRVQ